METEIRFEPGKGWYGYRPWGVGGELMFRLECEAEDDNRWYDMVKSIRDRTMTKDVYKQLSGSLRKIRRSIGRLSYRPELR